MGMAAKVADNLYFIFGRGGNTGVYVAEKGVVLVDTKNPDNGQGILDQVKSKLVQPALGVRVGSLVARGEAEIGVQQINELLPIPGIDFVGPLPGELQTVLTYSLAVPATAKERNAAAALVKYLTSEAALPVFKKLGLDPG